ADPGQAPERRSERIVRTESEWRGEPGPADLPADAPGFGHRARRQRQRCRHLLHDHLPLNRRERQDREKAMTHAASEGHTETAILGGGCFWCTEAVFKEVEGVLKVEPGYCGGEVDHPAYRQVCEGTTGHAEVVRITFDPQVVSFRQLLEVFFGTHDPT